MNSSFLHIKADKNWINDPNGFIYYRGKYHLFFQCFPYAPRWGRMHWGHAVSSDMVHWEYQRIALYPSKQDDRDGCFSGCAVEYQGKLYLYYTGVRYLEADPADVNVSFGGQYVSSQMLLISEDGICFDNYQGKSTIIPVLDDEGVGDSRDTRDPKVFQAGGCWYMLLGSTDRRKAGRLVIYKSRNLVEWSHVSTQTGALGFGNIWECPDCFQLDGKWVLLLSSMGITSDEKPYDCQAICALTNFNEEDGSMRLPDQYQFVDYGMDLYAFQSALDQDGRRTVVGWARMPEAVDGLWNGMLSIPRIVEMRQGSIGFCVHPNVREAFKKEPEDMSCLDGMELPVSRLVFELQEGEGVDLGGYGIRYMDGRIETDRRSVFPDMPDNQLISRTPRLRGGCRLEVYVDANLIEIFINDGEYTVSNVVYHLGKGIRKKAGREIQVYRPKE